MIHEGQLKDTERDANLVRQRRTRGDEEKFMGSGRRGQANTNKRPDTQHQLKVQITHHILARVRERASQRESEWGRRGAIPTDDESLCCFADDVGGGVGRVGEEAGHVYTTPSSPESSPHPPPLAKDTSTLNPW